MNEADVLTHHTEKDDVTAFLKSIGIVYLCPHCGEENAIHRWGVIACQECGGEILLNLNVIPMGDYVS
jgi:DNA-directed RNA polymerase subunit RPC12/RpoP